MCNMRTRDFFGRAATFLRLANEAELLANPCPVDMAEVGKEDLLGSDIISTKVASRTMPRQSGHRQVGTRTERLEQSNAAGLAITGIGFLPKSSATRSGFTIASA